VALMATSASIPRQSVFAPRVMGSRAYVTFSVPRFVSLEMVEPLRATLRQRSGVAVVGVKAVVNMPVKAAMAMEPWTGADKHAADIPVGPVVAVGRTVVGSIVEVPVWAHRRHSNIDGDLGGWRRG